MALSGPGRTRTGAWGSGKAVQTPRCRNLGDQDDQDKPSVRQGGDRYVVDAIVARCRKYPMRRYRFPSSIIQHSVWLYFRFPLSYRDVEDLLAERGVEVSYETVRRWALKLGQVYARKLRRLRPRADYRWHLYDVFVSINGKRMYLWRAVGREAGFWPFLLVLVSSRQISTRPSEAGQPAELAMVWWRKWADRDAVP